MRITWYGHAAFRLELDGLSLILDPYRSPDSGGYAPIDDGADVVIVSHDNDTYHSHVGQIRPPFRLVKALDLPPEGVDLGEGVTVTAVKVFETPAKRAGDEVAIVVVSWDGGKLVFLGDLGHPLDPAEVEPLWGADMVLVPAGGTPTIDLSLVRPLLEALEPRLVIPMHFWTPKINLKIRPVADLLALLPEWSVARVGGSVLEVEPGVEGEGRRIVLLEHAR